MDGITVRQLTEIAQVAHLRLMGDRGGFALLVTVSGFDRLLVTTRGHKRLFASLNTAAVFLMHMGIAGFEVSLAGYEPGRLRQPRPDRAAALRKTRTNPIQEELLDA